MSKIEELNKYTEKSIKLCEGLAKKCAAKGLKKHEELLLKVANDNRKSQQTLKEMKEEF